MTKYQGLGISQGPMPEDEKHGSSNYPKTGPSKEGFVPAEQLPDTETAVGGPRFPNPEEALLAKEETPDVQDMDVDVSEEDKPFRKAA